MAATIKIGGLDLCRAYTEAVTNTAMAAPAATLQTGTADSAYPVANVLTWNMANKFRAACVAGAMTVRIDYSSAGIQGSYNAVFVVEPYIPQYSPAATTATGFTSLALYSGSTAGTITTLEDTILAADLAAGDGWSVGQSRVWVLKISSASTLSTTSAGKFLELRWTGTGTNTFGCTKVCVYNMQSPFTDLSLPIMDSIQYNWIDRAYLNNLESGGQSRYQRPFIRDVLLPVEMAGAISAGIYNSTAAIVNDIEPYMLALDWSSNLVAGGEHIHTFPVRQNNGLQMSMRSQFSRSEFMMGDFALNYREYR